MNRIYVDNAATTKMSKTAINAMLPYLEENYGNPSSLHTVGQLAQEALVKAREQVAKALGAEPREIYFTSGGSEADNQALLTGAERGALKGKKHIISQKTEHHAILHLLRRLEKQGFEVELLDVDGDGNVTPEQVRNAIREDTALVTIMTANNEIGTIMPIKEIAAVCKEKGVLFHTDAVQAVGHIPLNVADIGCDMLSLSAHKFHEPKGVGMLYIRNGIRIDNLIHGGGQERGKRAATENLAGIAGLAKALEIAVADLDKNIEHMKKMRDRLIEGVRKNIPYCRLNGPEDERRLCNNVNFSFQYVEGESILMMLDMKGVAASSGSACTSGSLDPSHVLIAIGLPHEIAHGSLRLSVGEDTTEEDVDYVIEVLPPIIQRLRDMSPLYEGVEKGDN